MEIVVTKKIARSGKNLLIIIPKDVVEAYKLEKGMCFRVTLNNME